MERHCWRTFLDASTYPLRQSPYSRIAHDYIPGLSLRKHNHRTRWISLLYSSDTCSCASCRAHLPGHNFSRCILLQTCHNDLSLQRRAHCPSSMCLHIVARLRCLTWTFPLPSEGLHCISFVTRARVSAAHVCAPPPSAPYGYAH